MVYFLFYLKEEWLLLFVYIAGYPDMIRKTICDIREGFIAPNLICSYLSGLSSNFSVYYRRCKILMVGFNIKIDFFDVFKSLIIVQSMSTLQQNLPHLMPLMFARLYLLMCVRFVFNSALALLDIVPVAQM